eukprot:CAMPEP_0114553252 /NCGR_PEP_ID=MMETSP0114-20121206/7553_1 /TAXON_ID=31324 /ORGANISM="Goniomonas sp, Strain m" /LENGTH=282 /DNA_ID=CAMNT_0001738171 /DNA_START=21 /DNA_END=869 /DNA_ORIENTATION=-
MRAWAVVLLLVAFAVVSECSKHPKIKAAMKKRAVAAHDDEHTYYALIRHPDGKELTNENAKSLAIEWRDRLNKDTTLQIDMSKVHVGFASKEKLVVKIDGNALAHKVYSALSHFPEAEYFEKKPEHLHNELVKKGHKKSHFKHKNAHPKNAHHKKGKGHKGKPHHPKKGHTIAKKKTATKKHHKAVKAKKKAAAKKKPTGKHKLRGLGIHKGKSHMGKAWVKAHRGKGNKGKGHKGKGHHNKGHKKAAHGKGHKKAAHAKGRTKDHHGSAAAKSSGGHHSKK